MNGLKLHTATVLCRRDGQVRQFHYLAQRRPDGSVRYGVRYGCAAKTPGCADCIRCWRDLRRLISSRTTPTV